MRQVDIQARSVEEAVRLALEQLGRTRDQVRVEVLATDPNGDEVLVRVIAPDLPGAPSQEEISPRNRRLPTGGARGPGPNVGTNATAPASGTGFRQDRGNRPERPGGYARGGQGGFRDREERFGRSDRGERPYRGGGGGERFNRERPRGPGIETEELEPGSVELDTSLEPGTAGTGEHATPQDAVAPVAAEILQKVLEGMRVRGRIVRREQADEGDAAFADDSDSVILNVVGLNERDQTNLIGRRGETLDALQFIVNLIMGRKVDLWSRVIVDVEGYRLRRKLALMNLARRTAEQVQTRRQAIPLEAMPAYERRIIHMTLHDDPNVTTESTGVEPERRVVVLPK